MPYKDNVDKVDYMRIYMPEYRAGLRRTERGRRNAKKNR